MTASCSRWLDVTPDSSISDKDLFSTGFGFRNALNGIYLNLGSDALYGREMSWGFMSAISQQYRQTDDIDHPIYQNAAALRYNTIDTEPVIRGIWEKSYTVIANINKLIDALENTPDNCFEYGEDEKGMIMAEALALRAMLHFELLRLFSTSPQSNSGDAYIPYRDSYRDNIVPKSTNRDIIKKILRDIDKAEPILRKFDNDIHPKAMYSSSMHDVSSKWSAKYRLSSTIYVDNMGIFFWFRGLRMNYLAIRGLKAEVCLYAGPAYYNIAEEAAKELYDIYYKKNHWLGFTEEQSIAGKTGARYTKVSDDVLFGIFRDNLAKEYFSEVWRTSSNTIRIPLANIEELFASDNTGTYSDYRLNYLIGKTNETESKYFSLKYNESEDKDVRAMEGTLVPIIRFSEICHILAEINARNGDIAKGIEYLETVRSARGAKRPLSLTVKTKEQLLNEIILDIRKENLSEGKTFFTYKRMGINLVSDSDEKGKIDLAPFFVLPIPESETI